MGELAILGFRMIIIFPMGARKSIYNPMDNKRKTQEPLTIIIIKIQNNNPIFFEVINGISRTLYHGITISGDG
jgi:hypothetical protein